MDNGEEMNLNLEVRKFAKTRRNFDLEESTMAHTRKKMSKIAIDGVY